MTTQTVVVLDRLRCVHEHDGSGHSEPYLWPTLLWVDDATPATPDRVGVVAGHEGRRDRGDPEGRPRERRVEARAHGVRRRRRSARSATARGRQPGGQLHDTLSVVSDAEGSPHTVALGGSGIDALPQARPSTIR
jgi:hypothetical protein